MAELLFFRNNGCFLIIFEEIERKVETKTILLSALANSTVCMFSCERTFICVIIPFGRPSGFCELNYVCERKYRTNLDNSAG